MNEFLKICDNTDCDRQVRVPNEYCCLACALSERYGYEVSEEDHSEPCNSRHAKRGPVRKEENQ